MQHPWSFREHLVFSIGLALTRSRTLLRRLLKEHAPDDARQEVAERVVKHLEQSEYELGEDGQALRKRPPLPTHGMPGTSAGGLILQPLQRARVVISRLAVAFRALRVVAASSSASALRTASVRRSSSDLSFTSVEVVIGARAKKSAGVGRLLKQALEVRVESQVPTLRLAPGEIRTAG